VEDTFGLCGNAFSKPEGSDTRLIHITSAQPELFDALLEFRPYQCIVQAIELPLKFDKIDTPSTPVKASKDE
ncbi:hypothetical protein BG015_003100, partial [Linnemannia schmuckeri]